MNSILSKRDLREFLVTDSISDDKKLELIAEQSKLHSEMLSRLKEYGKLLQARIDKHDEIIQKSKEVSW